MLFYTKMRKISKKKESQAFTILEMLLTLSILGTFILIFTQIISTPKNFHKNELFTPLNGFIKIISLIKNGTTFKIENNCLTFQSLDTKKIYKITFSQKTPIKKDKVFIKIEGLQEAHWYYWSLTNSQWQILNQTDKTTPSLKLALKLKNKNTPDTYFEIFIFNTAIPYFQN